MTIASVLPTPPSSPSLSPLKPVIIPTASAAASIKALPLQPVKDAQTLSQPSSIPAATATLSTKLQAARNSPSRTLPVLKKDLQIDRWQCGAQIPKGRGCRRPIASDNKELIDEQLESMKDLTRASPDFESAVHKLVMLVQCYQHDAGDYKKNRLEAWSLIFPVGNADGSEPVVPVERLIRKALEPLTVQCIAQHNGMACEKRIGGQKVQNCERTLQELIKQETYSDHAKLEFLLKVLEWNRTCNAHQSSKQFTYVAAWKKSVMEILPLPIPLGDSNTANDALNEPRTLSKTQAGASRATTPLTPEKGKRPVLFVQGLPSPGASPGPTIIHDADPASYWPKAYDLSPFDILAHAKHKDIPASSHNLVRTAISKLLVREDLHGGYVYAYEVDGNKGFVKIGYTTRPGTVRHDEWTFDCNRQTKLLYPAPVQVAATVPSTKEAVGAPAMLIPHARRVEALCHAELDHRRIRIYCSACLKQHIEWFEVSAMEVTAVIQKWSRWMATRPYELLELRGSSKWTLKADEVRRTSRIEHFMSEIARVPASL